MHGLAILVAVTTVGVDYGWEIGANEQAEYIIQIEPELLPDCAGHAITSQIDPRIQNVRSFRIRVGNQRLPKDVPSNMIATASVGPEHQAEPGGGGNLSDSPDPQLSTRRGVRRERNRWDSRPADRTSYGVRPADFQLEPVPDSATSDTSAKQSIPRIEPVDPDGIDPAKATAPEGTGLPDRDPIDSSTDRSINRTAEDRAHMRQLPRTPIANFTRSEPVQPEINSDVPPDSFDDTDQTSPYLTDVVDKYGLEPDDHQVTGSSAHDEALRDSQTQFEYAHGPTAELDSLPNHGSTEIAAASEPHDARDQSLLLDATQTTFSDREPPSPGHTGTDPQTPDTTYIARLDGESSVTAGATHEAARDAPDISSRQQPATTTDRIVRSPGNVEPHNHQRVTTDQPEKLGSEEETPSQAPRRWLPFLLTLLALFASAGLNIYLGWIAWDAHHRYQDLLEDMQDSGSRRAITERTTLSV